MEPKIVAAISWSGGKDSTLSLYRALKSEKYKIKYLITTISAESKRISLHGVPLSLLEAQSKVLNIPLFLIEIPENSDMKKYNEIMSMRMLELIGEGVSTIIAGDIFLEHLKKYREEQCKAQGIKIDFPIWGEKTEAIFKEFYELGFKAITVAVNNDILDDTYIAKELNEDFLSSLPNNCDPCGEHGEYHSFVYDGPIFSEAVEFKLNKIIEKVYPAPDHDDGIHKMKETKIYFADIL